MGPCTDIANQIQKFEYYTFLEGTCGVISMKCNLFTVHTIFGHGSDTHNTVCIVHSKLKLIETEHSLRI